MVLCRNSTAPCGLRNQAIGVAGLSAVRSRSTPIANAADPSPWLPNVDPGRAYYRGSIRDVSLPAQDRSRIAAEQELRGRRQLRWIYVLAVVMIVFFALVSFRP